MASTTLARQKDRSEMAPTSFREAEGEEYKDGPAALVSQRVITQ